MKSEWSQEILNLGSVLERWGAWTLPEKVRDKSFRVPPWRVWGPGGRWSVDHTLGTQQAIKKKRSFSLAHTL